MTRKVILKTNFSNNVFVDVMSQYKNDNLLHLVAFFFKKHFAQEINYEIYDKKLSSDYSNLRKMKIKIKKLESLL